MHSTCWNSATILHRPLLLQSLGQIYPLYHQLSWMVKLELFHLKMLVLPFRFSKTQQSFSRSNHCCLLFQSWLSHFSRLCCLLSNALPSDNRSVSWANPWDFCAHRYLNWFGRAWATSCSSYCRGYTGRCYPDTFRNHCCWSRRNDPLSRLSNKKTNGQTSTLKSYVCENSWIFQTYLLINRKCFNGAQILSQLLMYSVSQQLACVQLIRCQLDTFVDIRLLASIDCRSWSLAAWLW